MAHATKLDGVNKGKNGGRTCWLVQATLCQSEVQGDFYSKLGSCPNCEFFNKVHKQEAQDFSYGMKEWLEMCGMSFPGSNKKPKDRSS